FAACKCVDSAPPTTFAGTPGQDDTSTPYLSAGFSIGNRYCPNFGGLNPVLCFFSDGSGTNDPVDVPIPPANVFTDVGYVRWDLSLDNSQFPAYIEDSEANKNPPYVYSSATMPGNFYFSYQLKPNTVLSTSNATSVNWVDCVENFSGFGNNPLNLNTAASCLDSGLLPVVSAHQSSRDLTSSNGAGVASLTKVSMNGGAANLNLTYKYMTPNRGIQSLLDEIGIGKNNPDATETRSGLFSNIGYYKFTFGPLSVRRPAGSTDVATGTVTERVAINTNLGFAPVSAAESTAFAPEALVGSVESRSCSHSSSPCVVTALYRAPGGSVSFQSFAPRFTNHATPVGSLPTGIVAVSTPKVIQDVSQLTATTDDKKAARLRTFVRAADGNIYMSKGDKGVWSSWMNLGRPWVADSAYPAPPATVPAQAYWAFTKNLTTAQTWTSATTATPNPQNEGISIVGEPAVAYYNDSTNPPKALIAVAVRVSQILKDGNAGDYHNAVFYTVGRATGTSSSNAFEAVSNWTRWLPVINSGNPIRIQGNPLIFVNDKETADNPKLYLFGTKLASNTMAGSAANLHPPIAPDNINASAYSSMQCDTFGNALCTYKAGTKNWFSYGDTLLYITKDLTGHLNATASINCTSDAVCSNLSWTNYNEQAGAGGVIISDLTGLTIDSTGGGNYKLRIFANALWGFDTFSNSCSGVGVYRAPISDFYPTTSSICGYPQNRTYVHWYEFALTGGFAMSDFGVYHKGQFVGTPYPVDLGLYRYTSPNDHIRNYIDPDADSSSAMFGGASAYSAGGLEKARFALFGRYTGAETRTAPPTIEYVVSTYPEGTDDPLYTFYRTTGSAMYNAWAYEDPDSDGFFYRIAPFYPTSDVMAFTSESLKNASVDVPVYLFTRGSNGALVVGIWQSSNRGINGSKQFNFFSAGGFVN
ncbi:MAG: hypothetical protein HYW49_03010, partial [Deltaproteobacteria bacterium]|nr:hypothetical protein [Deltaproteobacteria bacterium]